MQACDVLVCPSWSEGLPNVILEAMANGLAILATNVGATNILINEKTGWLLEKCSVSEIKNSLVKIISTKSEIINSSNTEIRREIKREIKMQL